MSVFAAVAVFLAEGEGSAHEAFHAEHTWLPETKEIIFGGIAFLVIFALLYKFGMPAVKKMAAERTERIRKELESSAAARAAAEADASALRASLADVTTERARIVEDARKAADAYKADAATRLAAEEVDLRRRASDDTSSSQSRLLSGLEGDVKTWSMQSAERIVLANLDDATHNDLIEQFIAELGARQP